MKTSTSQAKRPRKKQLESDAAVSYDEFKQFEGQRYTGMKVGRSHKWYYDKGEWKEKKITPDLWQISYAVTKRRAGRAPEGSGVPVGTEYHWYIVAHQNVHKLNANDYTTTMTGLKFKVAHKRADSEKWSVTPKTQRKRLIGFLKQMVADLERQQEEEARGIASPAAAVAVTPAVEAAETPARKPAAKAAARPARKPPAGRPAAPKSVTRPTRRRRTATTTTRA